MRFVEKTEEDKKCVWLDAWLKKKKKDPIFFNFQTRVIEEKKWVVVSQE